MTGGSEIISATDTEHPIDMPNSLGPIGPCKDLLGNREKYFKICIPLFKASITGNWKAAKDIFDKHSGLERSAITQNLDTALHIAASTKETKQTKRFVKKLVSQMESGDLELKNLNDNTAFCLAATAGNIEMIKIMVDKNPNLPTIPGYKDELPLYMSALLGRHNIVKYLYDASHGMNGQFWTYTKRAYMLLGCVECDFFDVSLDIVTQYPELGTYPLILKTLAKKAKSFNRVEKNIMWRTANSILGVICMKKKPAEKDNGAVKLLKTILENTFTRLPEAHQVNEWTPSNDWGDVNNKLSYETLFVAAEMGNTKYIVEFLRAYPHLIFQKNGDNHSIFHIAVMNRHHGIYNLLYELGSRIRLITETEDKDKNNMLHLVGLTSWKMRSQSPKATLQMQRELLWFKEVEQMIPTHMRENTNQHSQTPYELFSETNLDLATQSLDWMKDCMVVATLIVGIAFAVAFSVPGGYIQDQEFPVFLHGRKFIIFFIADAVSLFSSSTSLLVFLSILTSRHGQRDFMNSLPKKLMIGLVTLSISVASMMVTFSASFFVLYHNGLKWVPILIATFAALPVIIFAYLQIPLLKDMYLSMYHSHYLFKPKKRILYNAN